MVTLPPVTRGEATTGRRGRHLLDRDERRVQVRVCGCDSDERRVQVRVCVCVGVGGWVCGCGCVSCPCIEMPLKFVLVEQLNLMVSKTF